VTLSYTEAEYKTCSGIVKEKFILHILEFMQ